MQYPLKTRQVCFFIIAFTPICKLFILPSVLSGFSNEDAWISALINLTVDFLTLFAVIYACKKTQCTFFELLENNFGKTGKKIILALYFIYFMMKVILPLNEQKEYVELTLYTLKPTIFYFLPFFVLSFYLCTKKTRVLGRIADVAWLITINGILTLFILSVSNADFGALLPVFANPLKSVLRGSYSALNWFGDAVYIMFFIGQFKYEKRDGIKLVLSFAVSAIMILAFIIIFYCIFTSIAFRQRFALTEISKYTTVINNLGRFDYIGIIFILFVNLFSLSMPMYFSCKIFNEIFGIKKAWIAPSIVTVIQVSIILFLNQFIAGIERFMMTYAGGFYFLMGNVFPTFTAILVRRKNKYANA